MDLRRQAIYMGRGRALVGLSMLADPGRSARVRAGGSASASTRMWTRMTGIREFTIGVGTATAAAQRAGGADWLSMAAVCDMVDGVLALCARGVPRRTRLFGLVVLGYGLVQLPLARQLGDAEHSPA
jgi:hypothetical protein